MSGQALHLKPFSPEAPAVTDSISRPHRAAPATDSASTRTGLLLYIEDNPVNQLVVQELVAQRPGLELVCEDDGSSGLARAQGMRPDLILLDMQLPDFDGYGVIERLRADARTADIPCIALSANTMPEDIRRARAAGFADYWTKPIDFKAFLSGLDALFPSKP
jgi:CheY-like chemotaxis protein